MKKQELIGKYRQLIYFCHNQSSIGLMTKGTPCQVEDPEADITHGNVVHPCVRYIEKGSLVSLKIS